MKWLKSETKESESPEIGELMSIFKLKGFYFWKRNIDIMGQHFDIWNPGCNKFNKEWYFLQFHPWIKDNRTIIRILDFFQERHWIFYWFVGNDIILYFPELAKKADKYTENCLKNPEKAKKKRPADAGVMHASCRNHARKIALSSQLDAGEKAENKEDKPENMGSKLVHELGTSSFSSSKETSNNLNIEGGCRKKENKERDLDSDMKFSDEEYEAWMKKYGIEPSKK